MSDRFFDQNLPQILQEKYEIQNCLADKGGRKTLLARDLISEELVVIKLLTFGNDLTWEDLKLFEREAETLKSISHDSIPRYIDYCEIKTENNQGFALVQAYINAPSVEQQVQRRSFSEAEIQEFAIAILNILDYLHSRQPSIIHRDIKPSNILLGEGSDNSIGDIYLVDFGSVQNLAIKKGGTITVVGTYGYMPPEQFGGRAKPASDLYSLGATLIYIVTGQHPADLPENDLKIEFEQLVNISPGLTNWLKKMTEPSLSKRYKSAKEALQELAKCHLYKKQVFQYKKAENRHINKPSHSKVIFHKSKKSIEIKVPPAGVFSNVTYSNIAIMFSFFIFLKLLIPAYFLTDRYQYQDTPEAMIGETIIWTLILFVKSLTFITVAATFVFLIKLFLGIFGFMKLKISTQKIYLIYELFGIKRHSPMPNKTQEIYRLEKLDRSNRKSCLNIWSKKHKYQIPTNDYFPLTNLEIEWLGQELSSWLKLPLIEESEIDIDIKQKLITGKKIKNNTSLEYFQILKTFFIIAQLLMIIQIFL